MQIHWRNIIRRPVVTEKSSYQADLYNQYTFAVDSRANKMQVKEAVELAWPEVTVEKVRIANMPPKRARRWRRPVAVEPARHGGDILGRAAGVEALNTPLVDPERVGAPRLGEGRRGQEQEEEQRRGESHGL